MAVEDSISCYSCEGTLLVPTVHGKISDWRERLLSGNRLTITLRVVGKRWSNDTRFLLWGENYRQEKLFEVNLRYVRAYFFRTRTWHEITASDRRRFALNFQDSKLFARFYEELESTLSFLKKLVTTNTGKSDGACSIAVLRVDKLPPPKPPRALQQTPLHVGNQTPPSDDHTTSDCARQLQHPEASNRVVMGRSAETRESVADTTTEEQTTKWYVNIYDDATNTPPDSKFSDEMSGIYDTIADPVSSTPNPNENNTNEYIEVYDNVSDVPASHQYATTANEANAFYATTANEANAFSNLLYDRNSPFFQNSYPTSPEPMETNLYNDCGNYDNITTDVSDREPATTKSKPKLPRRCNDSIRNRPIPGVTTMPGVTNQHPNAIIETAAPKPVPLPRTKKQDEDKSIVLNWICDRCTLINPSMMNRCAACDMQRHGSRVQAVTGSRDKTSDAVHRLPSSYLVPSACFLALVAKEEWTCSICSARNRRESDVCHSCLAWICSHCTLHNREELLICSVCTRSRLLP